MIIVALLLLGLAWGSFVNAFVWRLHELETRNKLSKQQKSELSVLHGRSMCVHCRHTLAWYDLLPVISWVVLGGKCRYCHKPISWQYPLVELLTAGLFVLSYIALPQSLQSPISSLIFLVWLIMLVGFVALAVYDIRWMLLPDRIVYPLVVLAILQVVLRGVYSHNMPDVLIGALFGLVVIGGLFWLLFQISGGKWIGFGDVKLAFVIGPLVGSGRFALMVIFIASVIGTLVSLPSLAKKSLKISSQIPFGPFLIVATIIVYLYGTQIFDWYTRLLV